MERLDNVLLLALPSLVRNRTWVVVEMPARTRKEILIDTFTKVIQSSKVTRKGGMPKNPVDLLQQVCDGLVVIRHALRTLPNSPEVSDLREVDYQSPIEASEIKVKKLLNEIISREISK